jgi:hypothetical protein
MVMEHIEPELALLLSLFIALHFIQYRENPLTSNTMNMGKRVS